MSLVRVQIQGRFLCTKNYQKKDKYGNLTNDIAYQMLVFDGDNAVKISDVDGSQLTFGDDVSVTCDIYSGEWGTIFRAVHD